MLTTDIAPNRLERAKLAALELMQDAHATAWAWLRSRATHFWNVR